MSIDESYTMIGYSILPDCASPSLQPINNEQLLGAQLSDIPQCKEVLVSANVNPKQGIDVSLMPDSNR